MKLLVNRIISRRCTGIYISQDAVIGVTSKRSLRSWVVESIGAQINPEFEESYIATDKDVSTVKDKLGKFIGQNKNIGTVQVAFDDRYVRFFVLPISEKPGRNEIEGILRWHAGKILPNINNYTFASQLIETRNGFRLYGAAVSSEILSAVDEVLRANNLTWYLADSAASYIWNSFARQYRQGAMVYLSLGKFGWTLIVCDANGTVEMIKPGRWSYDDKGIPQIRKGMIEAYRLLTTYVDKHPQEAPERIYVDSGVMLSDAWGYAKELFGEELVAEPPSAVLSLPDTNVPKEYLQEISIAMKASLPR